MKVRSVLIGAAVAIAATLALSTGAQASTVDLARAQTSIRIDGQAAGDTAGGAVANAGDVNGDGRPDLIVGAHDAGNNNRSRSGSAYVVYGGRNLAHVDLQHLGARGFRIDGAVAGDFSGLSVGGAGDVNGDGVDDVIVGAIFASDQLGAAYVIYGQHTADPADVDLAKITTTQASRGFLIEGAGGGAGLAVAGTGDLNGDGIDDVAVGAPTADNNARTDSGSAYVIYGQRTADPSDVDLAKITTTQATRGFRIDGAMGNDGAGTSLAGAGDVNGDGATDMIVGADLASNHGRGSAGSAYVIYGQHTADPADVDLANLSTTQATRGFQIDGSASNDQVGTAVDGAGDVNGDGIDDVVVGGPFATQHGRSKAGSAFIVYGQRTADPTDVDLAKIRTTQAMRGFRIDGALADDAAGAAVAGTGDMNGDGIDDVVVGASGAGNNSRDDSGSAYVVYGRRMADLPDLDLAGMAATQASRVLRIDGVARSAAGAAVSGGSDLNGDGHPDAIIGAPFANSNRRMGSGSAYVLDLAAPQTVITRHPKATVRVQPGRTARVSFGFASSEARSRFSCKLDGGPFGKCRSPKAYELARGRHTFAVAASDAAGNTDATPATFRLQVQATRTRR